MRQFAARKGQRTPGERENQGSGQEKAAKLLYPEGQRKTAWHRAVPLGTGTASDYGKEVTGSGGGREF